MVTSGPGGTWRAPFPVKTALHTTRSGLAGRGFSPCGGRGRRFESSRAYHSFQAFRLLVVAPASPEDPKRDGKGTTAFPGMAPVTGRLVEALSPSPSWIEQRTHMTLPTLPARAGDGPESVRAGAFNRSRASDTINRS